MRGDPFLVEAFRSGSDIHTATAARVWGLARARSQCRSTPHGQDDQLRAALRHGGFRAGRPSRHLPGRGARTHRRLLLPVRPCQGLHGVGGDPGPQPGLHHHPVRPAPLSARAEVGQLPDPADGRADGAQRPGSGHCGRHHQEGDDRSRRRTPVREAWHRRSCSRSTTSSSWRALSTRSKWPRNWWSRPWRASPSSTSRSGSTSPPGPTWQRQELTRSPHASPPTP